MRSIARLANAALIAAALVAGCSSSSNGNSDGSPGPGGFGPTTKLVDLTPSQMMQVCKQQSANGGTGLVSCGADASMYVTPLGVCTSIQATDCTATVATSQTCATAINAAACDPKMTAAAMKTPECLVMLECTHDLCTDALCLCTSYADLSRCEGSCAIFTKGLTTTCASCIAGLVGANMCPNFAALDTSDAGVSQCASVCAQANAGG
jgi:hypothetical protein